MYSKHHAVLSLLVGSVLALALGPITVFGVSVPRVLLAGYAVLVGVFVDLDHFVIARYHTGSWRSLRRCLRNPIAAFTDQDGIFAPGDVGALSRLLSHLLLAGLAVSVLAVVSVPLAILTGVVLYVHVVSDVWWEIRQYRRGEALDLASGPDA